MDKIEPHAKHTFLKRAEMTKAKTNQLIHYVIFISIFVFTIYTGVIGIDFGRHWDERKLFASIRDSIPNGEILPGWYNYPSMVYDLVTISALPEIITIYYENRAEFGDTLEMWLADKAFVLRTRTVFLSLVTLSMLWVYILIFNWTKQWMQALFGAAILASSWEFNYHARWLAPDGILMQFGILTILMAFLALKSSGDHRFKWLFLGAITAGLTCGTKYYGGIFLLPVFISAHKLLQDKNAGMKKYVTLYSSLIIVFAIIFLLITPGALIQSTRFIEDIQFEINHYRNGHPGYTVNRGIEHASLMINYLFGGFFSKYQAISILFSAFALIGLYVILKDGWKKYETWIFLSIPLFYIPYMSLQKVMMVRNYLLLFPFLAILSAHGIMSLWKSRLIRSSIITRLLITAGMIFALLINFKWTYDAAQSIPTRKNIDQATALYNYLANGKSTFYLSNKAKHILRDFPVNELEQLANSPGEAEDYIFLSDEVENHLANRPNIYNPIFGPYEVNFDYYPSWDGDSRVIVMPMESALQQSQFGIKNKE